MTIPAVTNLFACYDTLGGLLGDLSDDEWTTQSLCPDWDVAGVVAHLGAMESVMTGWRPDGDKPAPFDKARDFLQAAGSMSGPELRGRFGEVVAARRADLESISDDVMDETSWTPVGVQTYGRFIAIRVFDFWVHEHDIRTPLARPGNESGPAAEMAFAEVHGSFGYIAGKKAGVPQGKSVTVHLTGGLEGDLSAVVEDRARVVDDLASADAEVTIDFLTFMQLACGRIDPDGPIGDGRATFAGDTALAEQLTRNLAFTM